jgi:hypothetical protein
MIIIVTRSDALVDAISRKSGAASMGCYPAESTQSCHIRYFIASWAYFSFHFAASVGYGTNHYRGAHIVWNSRSDLGVK